MLKAGTSDATSTVFHPSRLSTEMGKGQNAVGRKELGDFFWINTDWLTHMWLIAWMVNSWENWIIDLWSNWFIHLLMMWCFFNHHGVKNVNQNYTEKAFVMFTQTSRNYVETCMIVAYETIWKKASCAVSCITPRHSNPPLEIATIWQTIFSSYT